MTAASNAIRSSTPVDQINAALKGSVIDSLRHFIPSLSAYSNEEAFNVILSSPEMTQRSFRAFRDHPDAFADVLRTADDQPVTKDSDILSCGRTLAQVVALVVQAVAKRYFRAKLSLRRAVPVTRREPSLGEKVSRYLFGGPSESAVRRAQSHGDRLFQAMRDHLLFEWQLRLIPHYVGLPVPLVQALGARLLEFKEIEDIQWMVRTGQPLQAPTVRHAETAAPLHIAPDTGPAEALPIPEEIRPAPAADLKQAAEPVAPIVPENLPPGVSAQRYVSAVLNRVNAPLARKLAHNLGVNPRQLAMMLIRAFEVLPAAEFQRLGSSAPDSEEARRFVAAADAAGFNEDTGPGPAAEFARLYLARIRPLL
jgi:hypothetical protein